MFHDLPVSFGFKNRRIDFRQMTRHIGLFFNFSGLDSRFEV
jgi:hypothetical protein